MRKIFFAVGLLISQLSFAQSGWFWQNPLPTGNFLESSHIVNSSTIFINGYSDILKSTNGGQNWSTINFVPLTIDTSQWTSQQLCVFDENNIYSIIRRMDFNIYVGKYYHTYLKKTSNGGATWDTASLPYLGYDLYRSVSFLNPNTGYAESGLTFAVYKTTNAGANWVKISINSNDSLASPYFINQNTGFIASRKIIFSAGTGLYYKTTDGGNSWMQRTVPEGVYRFQNISFVNENTGWIRGGNLYKTTNGGTNFTLISPLADSAQSYGFINENTGWAVMNNNIYRTTNSGANWIFSLANEGNVNSYNYNVNFNSSGIGIAVGDPGVIYKSTNYGVTWVKLSKSSGFRDYDIADIAFANSSTGWICGMDRISRSTDGGTTWAMQDSGRSYKSIKVFDANTALAAGSGFIARTTNSGVTWTFTNYNYRFYDFEFLNSTTGYIWGTTGFESHSIFLKTTNAGISWVQQNTPEQIGQRLSYPSETTGYSMYYDGFYKTTNAGANWNYISIPGMAFPSKTQFTDVNTGWVLNDSGLIKTTNGGLNWIRKKNHHMNAHIYSFNFINQSTGYAYGGLFFNGMIFKTTDGGESWAQNNNVNTSALVDGFFLDANTGWLGGRYGTLIKTTTGGSVSVQQISSIVPDKFYLSQNYPNPFNPNTNIEFSLPQKSFVKLKVFDLLGREIANLVNENLSAGKYKYDFNASHLTSGIYFYKLETENFSETRKMVLVK